MRILICIGGMPYSVPTVRFGGLVAGLAGASVVLLNVVSREEQLAAGTEALATARDMISGVDTELKTRRGVPATEILREAQSGSYDVVVIGARDVLSLAELFTGSIARRAVRRIKASVMVVRRGRSCLQKMLICTAGWRRDGAVVEMGARLAQAAAAEVTLLHVTGPVPSMYMGLDAMEEEPEELLRTDTPLARRLGRAEAILDDLGVVNRLKIRHGEVAAEILDEAQEGNYDLVVVGASDVSRQARGLLMVDVTRQIVDRALRPVLVVRRTATTPPSSPPDEVSASDSIPTEDVHEQ